MTPGFMIALQRSRPQTRRSPGPKSLATAAGTASSVAATRTPAIFKAGAIRRLYALSRRTVPCPGLELRWVRMPAHSDTLVFVPAWNEEENLPAVLDELRRGLPDVDVLVVDDGSTDRTAEVARGRGAEVVSFGENRGLPAGIAAGYAYGAEHGYAFCGRVDADGQHPVEQLARLLELVREGACDVAVGSRFASGDGFEPYRYK